MKQINNDITEDIVSFEVAVLLQEKGFKTNLSNTTWYNELGVLGGRTDLNKQGKTYMEAYPEECKRLDAVFFIPEYRKEEFKLESYQAPTVQLVIKWLRVNFDIVFKFDFYRLESGFYYSISTYNTKNHIKFLSELFDKSPEAVYNKALVYVLKNLIN